MSGTFPNEQSNPAGAIPVWIAPGPSSAGYTPAAASANSVTTGGTSVVAMAGPIAGGFIANPLSAAAQGLGAAANLYINLVGTPGSTDAAAGNGTLILVPGASYNVPALASGVSLRVNAASSGHKFTAFKW